MEKKQNPFKFTNLCQDTYHRFGLGQEAKKHLIRQADFDENRTIPYQVQAWRPIRMRDVFFWAEEIGGLGASCTFAYPNAQGTLSNAKCCFISGVPKLKNPFVVAHSGQITAPFYALDVIRYYAKKYYELLPFIAIGKRDILFDLKMNQCSGILGNSTSEAYYNIMSMLTPPDYARKYQQATEANFYVEDLEGLYYFAKSQGLDEISLILCSGQASADKAILGRWMYMLKDSQFADIKINLVIVSCPIWLNGHTPDNRISEISLGRLAYNIGEMMRDTITLDGKIASDNPQRYGLQSKESGYFSAFEYIIKNHNCFGHPSHSHNLYGTNFKEAVEEVFTAFLHAYNSYSPEDYEEGIKQDIEYYQSLIGRFSGTTEKDFLRWCIASPGINFWAQ